MPNEIDSNAIVSHEQDGRVLSGVGVTADRLEEVMDRHAPPEPEPSAGPAAAPVVESDGTPPAAPVSRGRQRFSDLTREREEARAEAATAKAEREAAVREATELRQRLEQAAPARPQERAEPAAPPAAAAPSFPAFDIWVAQDGNAEKDYGDYVDARADHRYELRQAAAAESYQQQVRDVLAQERIRDQFQQTIQTSQDRGRKAYPDFDALLNSPAGQMPLARTQSEAIERVAFIAHHPQSEHIQYAILKDAALAERLRDSDPYTFGVTIAGLVPAARAAAPAWTPPPPPYAPVGASSPTTPTPSSELAKKGFDYDASGYREKRQAERKAFRGR